MHAVIKGTATIAEFKAEKEKMEQLVKTYYEHHKVSCTPWTAGDPVKAWWGFDVNLWIEYSSGQCWYYNSDGEWFS